VSLIGLTVTGFAFALSMVIFVRALILDTTVPGWTSVAVMLSFFNGVTLLIISMLGEYLVRILDQGSQTEPYHIRTIVNGHE
jgi:hypothetical protein